MIIIIYVVLLGGQLPPSGYWLLAIAQRSRGSLRANHTQYEAQVHVKWKPTDGRGHKQLWQVRSFVVNRDDKRRSMKQLLRKEEAGMSVDSSKAGLWGAESHGRSFSKKYWKHSIFPFRQPEEWTCLKLESDTHNKTLLLEMMWEIKEFAKQQTERTETDCSNSVQNLRAVVKPKMRSSSDLRVETCIR